MAKSFPHISHGTVFSVFVCAERCTCSSEAALNGTLHDGQGHSFSFSSPCFSWLDEGAGGGGNLLGSIPGKAAEVDAAATSKFRQAANSGVRAEASTFIPDTLFLCFPDSSANCI